MHAKFEVRGSDTMEELSRRNFQKSAVITINTRASRDQHLIHCRGYVINSLKNEPKEHIISAQCQELDFSIKPLHTSRDLQK